MPINVQRRPAGTLIIGAYILMAKTRITIREMLVEDIAAVVALGYTLFTAESPTLYRCWDEMDVLELYQNNKTLCLVAVTPDNEVVGFALGSLLEKPGRPWKYGWLEWLGVAAAYKRRRLARRLVNRLQDLFIEQDVRIMLVDTSEDNQDALRFFRKFGFEQEHRHIYMSVNLDSHPKVIGRKFAVELED